MIYISKRKKKSILKYIEEIQDVFNYVVEGNPKVAIMLFVVTLSLLTELSKFEKRTRFIVAA
jgi:hypothetical protein